MCKKKIESAAKAAGASYAVWNVDSKQMIIKYNSTSSNAAKIQESIAAAGYDTPKYKATEDAYNKLHECCKYERTASANATCCTSEKCIECFANGKCTKDIACCKGSECAGKDCCIKS